MRSYASGFSMTEAEGRVLRYCLANGPVVSRIEVEQAAALQDGDADMLARLESRGLIREGDGLLWLTHAGRSALRG